VTTTPSPCHKNRRRKLHYDSQKNKIFLKNKYSLIYCISPVDSYNVVEYYEKLETSSGIEMDVNNGKA